MSDEMINTMKEWLLAGCYRDESIEEINNLNAYGIVNMIDEEFYDGVNNFIRCYS